MNTPFKSDDDMRVADAGHTLEIHAQDPIADWRRRGLILDLDDTLYPHHRFVQSGFAAVAQHLATEYRLSAEDVFGLLTRSAAHGRQQTAFQALCARHNLDEGIVPELLDVFRSHQPRLWLGHGVADTLRALKADGWRLAILTNGLPTTQRHKVIALGVETLVDRVLYARHHAPEGKPAASVFQEALRRLGLPAEQCVCVGDDPHADVNGARAIGIRTIRLARPGVEPAPGCDADVVITSLSELPREAAAMLNTVTAHAA